MSQLTVDTLNVRHYVKVNALQREELKKLVFKKGLTIKNASKIINIKYATAKSIVNKFRKLKIKKIKQTSSQRTCQYTKITKNLNPKLNLITFVGGSQMSNNVYNLL